MAMSTHQDQPVVLGIDLGTQGLRAIAADPGGRVLATAQSKIPFSRPPLPEGWFEQNPQEWWLEACNCIRQVSTGLPDGVSIDGLAVDSTSGTILPVDASIKPLHPALMYNDNRSQPYVGLVREKGAALESRLGYSFGSSFALPKILWLKEEKPEIFEQAAWFIHAADYLTSMLSGGPPITDFSNALKTGYDLIEEDWPGFIEELGIPIHRLPQVVPSGIEIGHLSAAASRATGLREGIPIYSGATDGTAAQIASGAVDPGAWNSSLGTTLVLKGISRELVLDPQQRIYSHRHPDGFWMPGGASNTGTEWILQEFPGMDLHLLDEQAAALLPTRLVRYPLARVGERFPFTNPLATGFVDGHASTPIEAYAAGLEGLALLEKLCYEIVASIGASVGERIYTTGGGSKSRLWTELRASVLGREMATLEIEDTAMGAALLAAQGAWYGSLAAAAAQMVRVKEIIEPNPAWQPLLQEKYQSFLHLLNQRGYLAIG
jgi:D-ribulokinase